jgi:outer membrane protein assembly factor BamB
MNRYIPIFILLAGSLSAAEVPFGHANWKPSPTDPVGFAGQGANWYPGATPPTQWQEGTFSNAPGMIGRPSAMFDPGSFPLTNRWEIVYGDKQAKNILWKVPVAGCSDATPIVVGKQVIHVSSLHYVTCYDADTGKVLWQDELKAMHLPVLGADRKTVGPAPDPAQAEKLQKLYERSLAYERVARGACTYTRDRKTERDLTPRFPLIKMLATTLESWRTEVERDFPGMGAHVDKSLATLRTMLEDPKLYEGLKAKDISWRAVEADVMAFARGAEKITGLNTETGWDGYLPTTMASPVSDGEIVGVTMGNGQTAAYEVATGKRLWAFRDPEWNTRTVSHCPSPLLWKDALIVPSGFAMGSKSSGDLTPTTVRGIDKRTGKVLWEASQGPDGNWIGQSHGDHMGPCLARLPDGKGGLKGVVVGARGAIVDAETGAALGFLPSDAKYRGAGFQAVVGNVVANCSGGDNYNPEGELTALSWKDGKLVVGPLRKTETRGAGQGPFGLTDRFLIFGRGVYDVQTGKAVCTMPKGHPGFSTGSLAGNRLIVQTSHCGEGGRTREDLMCLMSFRVYDFSDPTQPKEISKNNLVGDASLPKDIADVYFPEFAKPEFKQHSLGGYRGISSHFGVRLGGVTCHGSRIYFASNMHLYCIGEK